LNKTIIYILVSFLGYAGFSQEKNPFVYKQIDTISLEMEVCYPLFLDSNKSYPAIVFFFGGGWNRGTLHQFDDEATYFSEKGFVCFLVDYRVKERHNTTPFESLKDAKSAMRYIRYHAEDFNVNPNKIIAAGASAGGHLAAATALIDTYNEETDDLSVSCIPNALILFDPVIDNSPGGYGYKRIGEEFKNFSPIHNISKGAPPTLFILGTNDRFVSVETANYFKYLMEKEGNKCELILFENEQHGFFNNKTSEKYKNMLYKIEDFLKSIGYIID